MGLSLSGFTLYSLHRWCWQACQIFRSRYWFVACVYGANLPLVATSVRINSWQNDMMVPLITRWTGGIYCTLFSLRSSTVSETLISTTRSDNKSKIASISAQNQPRKPALETTPTTLTKKKTTNRLAVTYFQFLTQICFMVTVISSHPVTRIHRPDRKCIKTDRRLLT